MKPEGLPPVADWHRDLQSVCRRLQALAIAATEGSEIHTRVDAVTLCRQHRRRAALFGEGLFSDPAWDILLDLYVQRERGRWISVSSACLAAQAPQATALRHLNKLVDRGLVLREADTEDRRRTFVALSDEGSAKMAEYLAQW